MQTCLHADDVPFVFAEEPAKWNVFTARCVADLGVDREGIRVVGSGRLGYSLKPGMGLSPFRDDSDVDLVIVNEALFDEVWEKLLRAQYPRDLIPHGTGGWLTTRQRELYMGWLYPHGVRVDLRIYGEKARPLRQFSAHWFNTLKRASRDSASPYEDVKGRLYRTWFHADLYYRNSLTQLRASLVPGE